jgi:hypothetical protein
MLAWVTGLRCPNCQAFVNGRFCKFCRSELPLKQGAKQIVGYLGKPVRVLATFLQTAFTPWQVGAYLAGEKRGAISGPLEMLGYTVAFYVSSFLVTDSSTLSKIRILLYSLLGLTVAYILLLFHSFLKSFGSARQLLATVEAALYPLALGLLVMAALVHLKIGRAYCTADLDLACQLPAWQSIVEGSLMTWLWLIFIIIQVQVHTLKWYKVVACSFLLTPAFIGWEFFLQALFMRLPF